MIILPEMKCFSSRGFPPTGLCTSVVSSYLRLGVVLLRRLRRLGVVRLPLLWRLLQLWVVRLLLQLLWL